MMPSEKMSNRKILYILLALLVAVAVWLYADMFGNNNGPQQAETTITDVPITYTGEDELADRGLMLMEEGTTASVDITLSGARMLIVQPDRDDIKLIADLSSVEKAGIQNIRYEVRFADNRFSTSMIDKPNSFYATVNVTELNSKTVDVICELVGNVAEGYSAGELQLSQKTLELRGQEEDIQDVSYVKVTLDIGEDAMETVSQDLTFQYYDAEDQLLEGTGIHPTESTIQVTMPIYVTKELQLVVDFVESAGARVSNLEYDIFPDTITVSGDAGVLRDIDSITLGQISLLDLLGSGATSHTFSIIIPEGCSNLSGVTRATLKADFKDITRAQVTTGKFTYSNLPSGKTVDILTQELTVSIFGTSADVAAVTGEDITVVADLSNYAIASGTYTVPAKIQVGGGGDIGVSGTYHVQITIQEETASDEPDPPPPEE